MSISPLGGYHGIERPSQGKTGEAGRADRTKIPTKNDNLPSKDDIKQLVRDKAAEFENAVGEKEKDRIMEDVGNLFIQYVSHGSPDRKNLLENALKTIESRSGASKKATTNIDTTKTLFDFLNEADFKRKGMKFDKAYPMNGGGTVTAYEVTGGGAIFDVKQNGQSVLQITAGCIYNNGVSYVATPLEQSLQKEIANVWHNACDCVKGAQMSSRTAENGGIDITV